MNKLNKGLITFGLVGCIAAIPILTCLGGPCFSECQGVNFNTACNPNTCEDQECYHEILQSGYYMGRCCAGDDNERGCEENFLKFVSQTAYGGPCFERPAPGLVTCNLDAFYCNCRLPEDPAFHDDWGVATLCWDGSCFGP